MLLLPHYDQLSFTWCNIYTYSQIPRSFLRQKKVRGSCDYILEDLAHMELETYIIPSIFCVIQNSSILKQLCIWNESQSLNAPRIWIIDCAPHYTICSYWKCLYPLLRKNDSFHRNFHLLLIFQDIVSVLIFSDIVLWRDLKQLSLGSLQDYSVIISNSILYDSISMQGTYNHVSLIRLE